MRTDVLVIGAGPYGIAAARELRSRGAEVAVVGRPFATWHRHTLDTMLLRSDRRASSIWSADDRWDLARWLAARSEPVRDPLPVEVYREYLREVAATVDLPVNDGVVERLRLDGEGFRADWDGGEQIGARGVVVATGMGGHRHVPRAFEALPPERVLHSWDTGPIQELVDRSVLVIGGGQSAAETVEQLLPRNRVTWAMREPPLFFREPLRAPTPVFKAMLAGSRLLLALPPPLLRTVSRLAFRTTITPRLKAVYEDPRVRVVIAEAGALGLGPDGDGAVRAADGTVYDTVIAATGFRFTLAGFSFLDRPLADALGRPDQPPRVDADFASAVRGLHFIGGVAEASHGPAMRFIVGSRHAARRVARRLCPGAGGRPRGVSPGAPATARASR